VTWVWLSYFHWRRQLWGTGARAPSTSISSIFWSLQSRANSESAFIGLYVVACPNRPVVLSLFIAWMDVSVKLFSLVTCPSSHEMLATPLVTLSVEFTAVIKFSGNGPERLSGTSSCRSTDCVPLCRLALIPVGMYSRHPRRGWRTSAIARSAFVVFGHFHKRHMSSRSRTLNMLCINYTRSRHGRPWMSRMRYLFTGTCFRLS